MGLSHAERSANDRGLVRVTETTAHYGHYPPFFVIQSPKSSRLLELVFSMSRYTWKSTAREFRHMERAISTLVLPCATNLAISSSRLVSWLAWCTTTLGLVGIYV